MSKTEAQKQIEKRIVEIQNVRSAADKKIQVYLDAISQIALKNDINPYIPSDVYGQGLMLVHKDNVKWYGNHGDYEIGDWIPSNETC